MFVIEDSSIKGLYKISNDICPICNKTFVECLIPIVKVGTIGYCSTCWFSVFK